MNFMENKLFAEVAAEWLQDKKPYVKKSTYCAYALLIRNHLSPSFTDCDKITETRVQTFVLNKLKSGLSQKAVKDMLVVLNMILRYAVRRGNMSRSDMDIKFPKPKARQKLEVLEMKDQRRIIRYLTANFSFMNLGIYICLCTGLRIGEVCALVWDDIDVERGLICVSKTLQRIYVVDGEKKYTEVMIDTPKSISSIREIPISQDLMKVLSPLKKAVAGNFYVLTNSPFPIEPRAYRNYYNRLMKQLDLPHVRFHGLRHTFATRCIESKCDYKVVSMLMGHSNIGTTLNLYVHPDIRQKRKCVEQMSLALAVDIDGEEGYEIAD